MTKLRRLLALAVTATLASTFASPLHAATREMRKTIPAVSEVEVRNLAGHVTLEASGGDEGEVLAVLHAEGKSESETKKLLQELDVAFESAGGRFTAHARYPAEVDRIEYPRQEEHGDDSGLLSSLFSGLSRSNVTYDGRRMTVSSGNHAPLLWVDLRVRLPRGAAVRVENAVGRVTGEAPGPVWVKSSEGDVRLERAARAEVKTGSGDVALRNVSGEVRVNTGSGDVSLERVSGGLDVSTGSGDVKVRDLTAAARLVVHTASGGVSIRGDLSAVREAKVSTASGDVAIDLAPSFPLHVDATTASGSLEVEIPGMKTLHRTDRELTAEVGSGGPSFRISTASGDVRVGAR